MLLGCMRMEKTGLLKLGCDKVEFLWIADNEKGADCHPLQARHHADHNPKIIIAGYAL